MLKSWLVAGAVILSVVGCSTKKDSKKEAQKINVEIKSGDELLQESLQEFQKLISDHISLGGYNQEQLSTQPEEKLIDLRTRYEATKEKATKAKTHYDTALNGAKENRSTVKINKPEVIIERVAQLSGLITNIDKMIAEIDVALTIKKDGATKEGINVELNKANDESEKVIAQYKEFSKPVELAEMSQEDLLARKEKAIEIKGQFESSITAYEKAFKMATEKVTIDGRDELQKHVDALKATVEQIDQSVAEIDQQVEKKNAADVPAAPASAGSGIPADVAVPAPAASAASTPAAAPAAPAPAASEPFAEPIVDDGDVS